MRLQSILAATDFSPHAQHAVERAAMICAACGISRGMILHVLELSWLDHVRHFVNLSGDVEQSMSIQALQLLEQVGGRIRESAGVTLKPRVCVGKALDTIVRESADYDLLALGARGKQPLRDAAIGTTAERLLRQATKPVLVVKRQPATAYRRVLVGIDFSPHSSAALAFSRMIAPESDVYLVHVFEEPFQKEMAYAGVSQEVIHEYRVKARYEADAQMRKFIETSKVDAGRLHCLIEHGSHIPTTLRDKAIDIGADLVVVGKHGQSLVEKLLLGSVTLHVLSESPCDVLVTPSGGE